MWVSLGGILFSDWTHPITGEPIPRSNTTSLGGSLFSDRTDPITGEPIPRSSTSGTSTRRVLEVAPIVPCQKHAMLRAQVDVGPKSASLGGSLVCSWTYPEQGEPHQPWSLLLLLFITAGMVVERKPCVRREKEGECDEEVECHGLYGIVSTRGLGLPYS